MFKLVKVICVILTVCNISCKVQQSNIAGKYFWADSLKISASELTLNQDSSFQYWFQAGDMYKIISDGRWSLSRSTKQLLLNSQIQSLNDIIRVEENRNSEIPSGEKRVSLFDVNNNPYFGYIIINPSSHIQLKFDKKDYINKSMFLKNVDIREIAVNYFDIGSKALFYTIKDTLANDIKIYIQINSIKNYRFFKNQKWQLGSHKLTDIDTSFNKKGKKVYLKKLN